MTNQSPLFRTDEYPPAAEFTTGLLPSQKLNEAIQAGHIRASLPISPDQVQPSSIDLRLGPQAHRVPASFLPRKDMTVAERLNDLTLDTVDLTSPALLARDNIYIVPLLEEVHLPHSLWGKANPKSSTGRLDVFTRLLADYADKFERVPEGCKGKLYAEVVPRTFSLVVEQGERLNQVRLLTGKPNPEERALRRLHRDQGLVYSEDEVIDPIIEKKSLSISLDLRGLYHSEIVGYKARRDAPPIELSRIGYYDPVDYWIPIPRPEKAAIILTPDDFYILASKERVLIPPGSAAEMVSFEPDYGEFRPHYAGFFDPGFGCRTDDLRGTHVVLEVRSHGVPFLVEDGQRIGRLIFERMLSIPDKLYGRDIGSSYQFQGLALSKQFKR
jgi:dCTP deaminase